MPGPPIEVFASGGRIEEIFGFGPLTGAAANMTLFSYRGSCGIGITTDPVAVPDAHVFRIEDGKIRYVHTVTNCGEDENCGFGPFKDMLARNPDFYPNLDHVAVVTRPQK